MNEAWDKAVWIIHRLHEAGQVAYVAGGAVRDRLLARPFHDVDVATDADLDTLQKLFPASRAVGRAFGVLRVGGEGPPVEVAGFRLDGPYSDGRRPDWVRPATAQEDARRRDFTVNGMFFDVRTDRVLDWVGGQADLAARIIRCIGEPPARFREDYLRLFRAIRFAVRLDFAIEPETRAALQAEAPRSTGLAAERVRDELTAILTGPRPGEGLRYLASAGLLELWLPEVFALRGLAQPADYHPEGDAFVHTCLALEALRAPGPALAWATLLHDIGKPATARMRGGRLTFWGHADLGAELAARVARRLRLSNRETDRITALIGQHMRFLEYPRMNAATRRRFLAREGFAEHLELHRADRLASSGDLAIHDAAAADFAATQGGLPPPLLSGADLIAAGYRPGPEFSRLLEEVRERQLSGELADRAGALAFLHRRWPPTDPG